LREWGKRAEAEAEAEVTAEEVAVAVVLLLLLLPVAVHEAPSSPVVVSSQKKAEVHFSLRLLHRQRAAAQAVSSRQ